MFFFFSSRRRHTRCSRDWSSDVCSSDLAARGFGNFGTSSKIMMASFQTQKAKPKSHERFSRPALQDLPSTSAHGLIRSAGKCPAEQRDERDWFGQELGCGGPSPYSPQDSDFRLHL